MKDIPGYEGEFAVTEDGRVWRYPHQIERRHARGQIGVWNYPGNWITPHKDARGYLRLRVKTFDKGGKTRKVHRLVAEAFIPNPNGQLEVNHRNGIKHDNRVENLEWVSQAENAAHAIANGLMRALQGEEHGNSKLTEAQVKEIRAIYVPRRTPRSALARQYRVSKPLIDKILSREIWRHVA